MKPSLVAALISPVLASSVVAQTAADPNEGLSLQAIPGTPGGFSLHFFGKGGRTYFLQRSTDLIAPWEYFPVIETGGDAAVSYGFTSDAPRIFIRLRHLAGTFADPYSEDADGDGLTNRQEFSFATDPLSAADGALDLDGDGLDHAREARLGLDPFFRDANALGLELYTP